MTDLPDHVLENRSYWDHTCGRVGRGWRVRIPEVELALLPWEIQAPPDTAGLAS
jgi:hypothetical protein